MVRLRVGEQREREGADGGRADEDPEERDRAQAAAERLRRRLADRLLLRVEVVVGAPGSIPRQELGKAQRVFERIDERDPLAP